jgi:spore germination cell wall hydrolase CwlJ-like protein
MKGKWLWRYVVIIFWVFFAIGFCRGAELTHREVIAMTILGEARGEGKAGMYAVACVIAQRAVNRNKTPKAVCLQPWQFSCWNESDVNRAKLGKLYVTHPMRRYAMVLAANISNLKRSYTKNADHYCHINENPYWSYKTIILKGRKVKLPLKPVVIIGNHKFYKLRK